MWYTSPFTRWTFQGLLFPAQTALQFVIVLLRAEPSRPSRVGTEQRTQANRCPWLRWSHRLRGRPTQGAPAASQQALSPSHGLWQRWTEQKGSGEAVTHCSWWWSVLAEGPGSLYPSSVTNSLSVLGKSLFYLHFLTPPVLNPVVYTIKTKQIRLRMLRLFRSGGAGIGDSQGHWFFYREIKGRRNFTHSCLMRQWT